MELNEDQLRARDEIFLFLLDPNKKEIALSGGPGTGKTAFITWFMSKGISWLNHECRKAGKVLPYTYVNVSATTNKAADNIAAKLGVSEIPTIHSYLNLIVYNDYKTGRTILRRNPSKYVIIQDTILFIDECSMIDKELKRFIDESTHNCKIIYVGDQYQLAPVNSSYNIFKHIPKIVTLEKQVRFNAKQGIQQLAEQLKETVRTKEFKPIHTYGDEVVHYTPQEAKDIVADIFADTEADARIITYTNNKSIDYNTYIKKEIRGQSELFNVGDHFVCANCVVSNLGSDRESILYHVEDDVLVTDVGITASMPVNVPEGKLEITCQWLSLENYKGTMSMWVPYDHEELAEVIKFLSKCKRWKEYFYVKDCFPDLRPRDSSTTHKIQGTTLKEVIVDLNDLGKCRNPDTTARLLYVACTRATDKVILIGDLPKRYGGKVL